MQGVLDDFWSWLSSLLQAHGVSVLALMFAYLLPWFLGPVLVRKWITEPLRRRQAEGTNEDVITVLDDDEQRVSNIIGRCENVLTVTFVLMEQVTGLGIIIAAKALVRRQAHPGQDAYYLGGTLLNLAVGVACAALARLIV